MRAIQTMWTLTFGCVVEIDSRETRSAQSMTRRKRQFCALFVEIELCDESEMSHSPSRESYIIFHLNELRAPRQSKCW